jgi:tetraacyldisaccharide 4'-kinase
MRAPDFWWQPTPSLTAKLLRPAGALYGALTAARMARAGAQAAVPVICIGNLVAGGAGKTPTALAVARMLQAMGHRPAFLSRGYGRKIASNTPPVFQVDLGQHDADICGDEPLLLSRLAPTFVAADRVAAADMAVAAGATMLVLDDGLQNPALAKTFSIAVVDGVTGIGNRLCLPAGPLRAPVARQWPFVSYLCVIGEGEPGRRVAEAARAAGIPAGSARLEPEAATLTRLRGQRLYAFAGIGRPQKFFATLEAAGLAMAGRQAFPDHHRFEPRELDQLRRSAEQAGALLITTTKDRMRLPAAFEALTLPVELVFNDAAGLYASLAALRV